MAFQAVPDTVEITINSILFGQQVQNTHYAARLGGYTLTQLEELAEALSDYIVEDVLSLWATEVSFQNVTVRGLAFENDIEVVNSSATGFGSASGQALPPNVAYAVRKTSGLTGRSARGRTYWYGLHVNSLSANEAFLSSTWSNFYVGAVDGFRQVINSLSPWAPVLVSRYTGGEAREVGLTFNWIATSAFDLRVDSQRARLP